MNIKVSDSLDELKGEIIDSIITFPRLGIDDESVIYPTAKQIKTVCNSYFEKYFDRVKMKQGLFEPTKEAYLYVSKEALFNSVGILRETWEAWKRTEESLFNPMKEEIRRAEQVIRQIDEGRVNVRGNTGDIAKMRALYPEDWGLGKGGGDDMKTNISPEKTNQILLEISNKSGTNTL